MVRVAIIDYGVGNLYSITCALRRLGGEPLLTSDPRELSGVDGVILPGVGNFAAASQRLEGVRSTLEALASEGIPFLGICLGLQLFFPESEEAGGKGLGFMEGRVVALPEWVKRPHMGWNNLHLEGESELLEGIEEGSYVYFAHSYYPLPERSEVVIAQTDYGIDFPSALAEGNLYGTQFHPEKSGRVGFQILKNFLKIVEG